MLKIKYRSNLSCIIAIWNWVCCHSNTKTRSLRIFRICSLPLLAALFLLVGFSTTLCIQVCVYQVDPFFGIHANSVYRNNLLSVCRFDIRSSKPFHTAVVRVLTLLYQYQIYSWKSAVFFANSVDMVIFPAKHIDCKICVLSFGWERRNTPVFV